jgi:excisionase family DNA binding protein
MSHTDQTYYTVTEAAKTLRVHRNTAVRWCKEGYIRAARVGRKYLISQSEINRILDINENNGGNLASEAESSQ